MARQNISIQWSAPRKQLLGNSRRSEDTAHHIKALERKASNLWQRPQIPRYFYNWLYINLLLNSMQSLKNNYQKFCLTGGLLRKKLFQWIILIKNRTSIAGPTSRNFLILKTKKCYLESKVCQLPLNVKHLFYTSVTENKCGTYHKLSWDSKLSLQWHGVELPLLFHRVVVDPHCTQVLQQ